MSSSKPTKKSSHPLGWVPTVYFAMGLPFVVLNMVAAIMFKNLEIPNASIAFWTSLIMWPWTIKFLWSPFLEIFKTKKFFVVSTQIISGALFGLAALVLNIPDCFAVLIAIFAAVAFSGATHDIAADGVYMSELSSKHQSQYIGWQGAFYNLAKLVATGGLVGLAGILARHFSGSDTPTRSHYLDAWMIVLGAIGLLLLLLGTYHSWAVPSKAASATSNAASMRQGIGKLREVIADFFTKRYIWYYIAFIILYRLGEGFVMKIVPLFLMSDRASGGLELSNEEIGLYYGSFGSAAFLIGSLLAGYFIAHRGLKKSLFSLCCIFNIPFVAYAMLAWFQPEQIWITAGAIAVEYFGYGFGFVGLTLFMMQQVAPDKHQMAHYAFASGIMNFSVMLTGAVSGYISDALGYNWFFTAVMVATVPAFIMTWFIPFSHKECTEEKTDNQNTTNDHEQETENNDSAPAGYAVGGETVRE